MGTQYECKRNSCAIIALSMLLELVVENYAVVERLRVHFHAGLNLLTGETGSGKSIVVDALGLLLGGRASADMVRTGEARARVAGIFEVRDQRARTPSAGARRPRNRRRRTARSSARSWPAASRAPSSAAVRCPLSLLQGSGAATWPISTANTISSFCFRPTRSATCWMPSPAKRELLDRVAALYAGWRAAAAELEELERTEQEKLRLLDLWSFQRKEIEGAALEPDEDAALENERRVLQNVQKLQESAGTAYDAVYESPESALSLTRIAAKRVDELCRIDSIARRPARASEVRGTQPYRRSPTRLRDYLSQPGGQSRTSGRSRDPPRAAIDQAQAQVRPVDRRDSHVSWTKCARRSRAWSTPASAWRRCASSRSGWPANSRSWRAELTERRARRRPAAGEARGGRTGAAGHGAHRVPHRRIGGRMVGRRRRPRRVPGLARTWAKNRGRSKRSHPAAKSRASRWR